MKRIRLIIVPILVLVLLFGSTVSVYAATPDSGIININTKDNPKFSVEFLGRDILNGDLSNVINIRDTYVNVFKHIYDFVLKDLVHVVISDAVVDVLANDGLDKYLAENGYKSEKYFPNSTKELNKDNYQEFDNFVNTNLYSINDDKSINISKGMISMILGDYNDYYKDNLDYHYAYTLGSAKLNDFLNTVDENKTNRWDHFAEGLWAVLEDFDDYDNFIYYLTGNVQSVYDTDRGNFMVLRVPKDYYRYVDENFYKYQLPDSSVNTFQPQSGLLQSVVPSCFEFRNGNWNACGWSLGMDFSGSVPSFVSRKSLNNYPPNDDLFGLGKMDCVIIDFDLRSDDKFNFHSPTITEMGYIPLKNSFILLGRNAYNSLNWMSGSIAGTIHDLKYTCFNQSRWTTNQDFVIQSANFNMDSVYTTSRNFIRIDKYPHLVQVNHLDARLIELDPENEEDNVIPIEGYGDTYLNVEANTTLDLRDYYSYADYSTIMNYRNEYHTVNNSYPTTNDIVNYTTNYYTENITNNYYDNYLDGDNPDIPDNPDTPDDPTPTPTPPGGDDDGDDDGGGGIWDWIGSIGDTLGNLIKNIGKLIADLVSAIGDIFVSLTETIPDTVIGFFSKMFSWVPDDIWNLVRLSMVLGIVVGLVKKFLS